MYASGYEVVAGAGSALWRDYYRYMKLWQLHQEAARREYPGK